MFLNWKKGALNQAPFFSITRKEGFSDEEKYQKMYRGNTCKT